MCHCHNRERRDEGGGHRLTAPEALADPLNSYTGANWPAPPWDGNQLATLALLLSMAEEG
jgi:hypothetical protein